MQFRNANEKFDTASLQPNRDAGAFVKINMFNAYKILVSVS